MAKEIVLVEYDKACRQLERAVYANEVMKIRETAAIMKACAKVMQNKKLESDAWKLRIQAERKLGEMLRDGKDDRAPEGRPKTRPDATRLPTLPEMKISNSLADRARKLAALDDEDWKDFFVNGAAQNERHAEMVARNQSKPKKKAKPKPERELECPHCGKPVYLKGGRLEK